VKKDLLKLITVEHAIISHSLERLFNRLKTKFPEEELVDIIEMWEEEIDFNLDGLFACLREEITGENKKEDNDSKIHVVNWSDLSNTDERKKCFGKLRRIL